MYKYCPGCKTDKEVSEFGRCKSNEDGLAAYCKTCMNERARAWRASLSPERRAELNREKHAKNVARGIKYKQTPEQYRRSHLKTHYNMTLREYDELLAKQDFRCIGCGKLHTEEEKLCVDHVHDESKRVRGLLCDSCNRGLGLLRDNPITLVNLLAYIQQWGLPLV